MKTTTTNWAPDQRVIFDELKYGTTNLAVCAGPGAGKSTLLLECLNIIPKQSSKVFLSFSNAIVNELKTRVSPEQAKSVRTLHSLGYEALRNVLKRPLKIEANKYFLMALSEIPKNERDKKKYKECFLIQDICNYARMTLTDYRDEGKMAEMCAKYSLDWTTELLIQVRGLLNMRVGSVIDFTDMIYLPIRHNYALPQYEYVFVDEGQDLNNTQRELVRRIVSPKGRVVIVGDNKQAIFGFGGADVDSFEKNVDLFKAKLFSLHTTFRCSQAVVRDAKEVYDEINAWQDSPEGSVRNGDVSEAQDGDLILCRNTKPLIDVFFRLLQIDKKSFIVGKEIEKGLESLAEKCFHSNIENMMRLMEEEIHRVEVELKAKGINKVSADPRYRSICEKVDVLRFIMQKVDKASDVISTIHNIFAEDKKGIKLMTIHRSKGLECERVFIIDEYENVKLIPSKYASKPDELKQEKNLNFVARTRAKNETIYVHFQN